MKIKTPIPTLVTVLAVAGATAAPVFAAPPTPPGPPGAADEVLDQDFSVTSAMTLTSPGKARTRTVHGPDGTHTVVKLRAVKAAGAITTDIAEADGSTPSDLAGTLKFTARNIDAGADGDINAVLTVTSADGRLRMRLSGPVNDDGSYDADIVSVHGSGGFAGIRVDGDADIDATSGVVDLDVDGEYQYGGDAAGPPAPPAAIGPAAPAMPGPAQPPLPVR